MADKITLKDLQKLHAELAEGQRELQAAQKKTEEAQQRTEEAQQRTEEAQQSTHSELKEMGQRMEREWRERDERMEQDAKSVNRGLAKLENLFTTQWGKLMEALVDGDLVELLREEGIDVEFTMQNIKGERGGERWEVDILALNGEDVVVVEVKTVMRVRDVDRFVERTLKNFRKIFPRYAENRILGAVAYLREEESSAMYAEKRGLFVIRATGSSASMINRQGFKPARF